LTERGRLALFVSGVASLGGTHPMLATLLLVVLALPPALDGADEQYAFISGLAEKGMHDRVVKEAESFLEQYPRHPKADSARYRLACALFELHDTNKAASEFEKLSARTGFEFEAEVAFRLGQCRLEKGDCTAAATAFQRAIDLHKDYLAAPAQWLLGEAHLRCGEPGAAEADYRAVLALDPRGKYAADAQAGLAWCAFKSKSFDAAAERAKQCLDRRELSDRRGELEFLLGESLLELGRTKEALQAYESVGSGAWLDGALRGAGFAHAALGDHELAARSFTRVPSEWPDSRYASECALHAGIEWLAANRPNDALEILRSKAAGESVDVLSWRSRAEAASGDAESAVRTLDRALELAREDETRSQLHSQRADLLSASGRKDEARREYERAGSDYALQAAAVAALQANKPDEALRSARKLLEQYPKSSYRNDASMVIGEALLASKEFDRAAESFESVITSETDAVKRTRAQSRLAWCRYLGGKKREAAESFAKLAEESPGSAEADEAQFMTARAQEATGEIDAALALYDRYLERHPRGARREEAEFRRAKLDTSSSGITRLESFLREHPQGELAAKARYEIAERSSSAGDFPRAIAGYREVLEKDADSDLVPAATYGLAWCLQRSNDPAGAAEILSPWIEAKDLPADLRVSGLELLVWSEAHAASPERVMPAWRALIAATNDEARLLRTARAAIDGLRKSGRGSDATAIVDSFAKRARDPKVQAQLSIERVYLSLDQKRIDAAERELERAGSTLGDDAGVSEAAYFVGEAHLSNGDSKRALEFFDRAAKAPENPARDRALYKAGFARLKSDDAAGAERCFAEFAATDPRSALHADAEFLLGEAQFRQKKYDEAIATLERLREEPPSDELLPKVLFRLGLARVERENWKGALEALTALAAAKPDFENAAEADLARGRALAHLNRARDARSAFERTIALDRGALSARAHLELGRMHLAAKELDRALSEFLKVEVLYDLPEETAEALMLAGETLEAQGDTKRAADQYREVVDKHASSPFAAQAKKRLSELQPKSVRRA
jgi:TolA-binding protein